jgi:hypothetical protein
MNREKMNWHLGHHTSQHLQLLQHEGQQTRGPPPTAQAPCWLPTHSPSPSQQEVPQALVKLTPGSG